MTIRIAFTGTGYISKIHAAAAQSAPDAELAAVVNDRHESLAEFAAVYESARTGDVVRL
ncbi:MAG TPA: hypothetical protein VFL17_15850 [Anaerolineae bacterium]|nr:hypothetical protein [Anaerolineae bacterium]